MYSILLVTLQCLRTVAHIEYDSKSLATTAISITVLGRVILGCNHKTSSLARSSVHCFDYIYKLLLVVENPVDLVVVSCSQVDHDMLVPEKEHHRTRIVQLVHCIKVGDFGDINEENHCEILDFVCYSRENLSNTRRQKSPPSYFSFL